MIREKQSASIRSIEKDRGISNVLKFIRIGIRIGIKKIQTGDSNMHKNILKDKKKFSYFKDSDIT